MFNSQFNIDSVAYGNKTFKILMPTGSVYSTIQITLPSGYYSYATINATVQAAIMPERI